MRKLTLLVAIATLGCATPTNPWYNTYDDTVDKWNEYSKKCAKDDVECVTLEIMKEDALKVLELTCSEHLTRCVQYKDAGSCGWLNKRPQCTPYIKKWSEMRKNGQHITR